MFILEEDHLTAIFGGLKETEELEYEEVLPAHEAAHVVQQ